MADDFTLGSLGPLDHVPTTPYPATDPVAGRDGLLTTPFVDGDLPATPGIPEPSSSSVHIGRYRLLSELARGGMGVVYLAHDTELNRRVALKMIRGGELNHAEDVVRFRREAQAAAQLDHPHIIKIFEIGQHQGEYFFTMALAAGGSLSRHLRKGQADSRSAAVLVAKVARALDHAHRHGVLHRDLKPGNILLDERGEPLVADFGLAKFTEGGVDLTQPGVVMGTPAYMAPEQASGQAGQVGPATDIWALGVLLYEMLAGRRPFASARREEVLRQIQSEEPTSLCSGGSTVPRDLDAVVRKCLEKRPGDRYASAAALADDLESWLDGRAIRARPPHLARRAVRAVRRHPAVAVAVLLVAAALLGVAAVTDHNDPDRPARPALRELAAGRRVVLVPEEGHPAYHRLAYGVPEIRPPAPGLPFTVRSVRTSLVQLLPRAPRNGFRLSAEVHLAETEPRTWAGVYFGHDRAGVPASPHTHWGLLYTETPRSAILPEGVPVVGTVRLCANRFDDAMTDTMEWNVATQNHPAPLARPGAKSNLWRKLSVVVSATHLEGYWDGAPVQGMGPNGKTFQELDLGPANRRFGVPEEVAPGLPLGLLVRSGEAEFRNVVIEPLP